MIRRIFQFAVDRKRFGVAEVTGMSSDEVLFLVDGVGGFQFCAMAVRRALRLNDLKMPTVLFDWQYGVRGEIFSDLMWLRRNRVMAARLARKLLTFRRNHPRTRIHIFAVSAGTGIAAFALEALRGRRIIDTLVLACPALSSSYNLGPALRTVQRAFALVSERDSVILGLGTRLFGTVDRQFQQAAGRVSFRLPPDISDVDRNEYERLRQIRWSREMSALGNHGGHSGWVSVPFLQAHLRSLLDGDPEFPSHSVESI